MTDIINNDAGGAQPSSDGNAAPVQQPSEQQSRAQAEVTRLRANFKDVPSAERDAYLQRMTKLSRFAQGYGEKPDDYEPEAKEPDQRPYDPERADFERLSQPANSEQVTRSVDRAVIQGLDRGIADEIGAISQCVGLPDSSLRVVLERAVKHLGAADGEGPAQSYQILENADEIADFTQEAARRLGGLEKLEQMSELARRYLATKKGPTGASVLEVLDGQKLTQSTLAFDPFVLQVICNAARREGIE
jgi:hypothetical protein